MAVNPWPPLLGKAASADGCITRLHFIINQPTDALERRIGYAPGRLNGGWWLLLLTEPVKPGEFEFFGHSHFSGGRIGHPSSAGRQSVEDSLRDLVGAAGFSRQQQMVADSMAISGHERIAKIVPRSGEDPTIPANEAWRHYPPGSGIPQWRLTATKQFIVAADVADGRLYRGGGAGFWLDPQAAKTVGTTP